MAPGAWDYSRSQGATALSFTDCSQVPENEALVPAQKGAGQGDRGVLRLRGAGASKMVEGSPRINQKTLSLL